MFAIDQKTLTVKSIYSGAYPGTLTADYGTSLGEWVTNSPVAGGVGTQYVVTGWSINDNDPLNGPGTNVTLTLTNDATLTWIWSTNVQFTALSAANGGVTGTPNGWYAIGGSVTVTAVPNAYYHFSGWSGDVSSPSTNDNPLTFTLDFARVVAGTFAANLATNYGTPEWWLASYGLTNDTSGNEETNDSDGDGMPNWEEYVAGTDPTNADSVFTQIVFRSQSDATNQTVMVATEPGREYTVYFTDDAPSGSVLWIPFANTNNGFGTWIETNAAASTYTFVDDEGTNTSGSAPMGDYRLYRVKVSAP